MNQTPSLTFVEAIKKCFSNYANFNGRARRSEFWWWYLFSLIVSCIINVPLQMLISKKQAMVAQATNAMLTGGNVNMAEIEANDPTNTIIILGIIAVIISLALLLPSLAVMARRLHDVGKSGHMMWFYLLCGVGGLIPLVMCIPDGNPTPNQYGESPKYMNPVPPVQPQPQM